MSLKISDSMGWIAWEIRPPEFFLGATVYGDQSYILHLIQAAKLDKIQGSNVGPGR